MITIVANHKQIYSIDQWSRRFPQGDVVVECSGALRRRTSDQPTRSKERRNAIILHSCILFTANMRKLLVLVVLASVLGLAFSEVCIPNIFIGVPD